MHNGVKMEYVFHVILTLICISKINPDPEVVNDCYPSVVRHRIDSLFPTKELFCVSRKNDEVDYSDIGVITNEREWKEFHHDYRGGSDERRSPSVLSSFTLPASISMNDECNGIQNIEVNRNITINCKYTTDSLDKKCNGYWQLNAKQLFNRTIKNDFNNLIIINNINDGKFINYQEPKWNGTICNNILIQATLNLQMNGSQVIQANVSIRYGAASFKSGSISQKINVNYQGKVYSNKTSVGYKQGDPVYFVNGIVALPFRLPTVGDCYSPRSPIIPVEYGKKINSACYIKTISCLNAKQLAKSFYDQVIPHEVLSAPNDESQPAIVHKTNISWDERSSNGNTCQLPINVIFQIYTAKQGTTKNYQQMVVAANFRMELENIPYTPGENVLLPIQIEYHDVTPKPNSVFASLPYIDIRLPNDFFYPFVKNNSISSNVHNILGCIIMYIVAIL